MWRVYKLIVKKNKDENWKDSKETKEIIKDNLTESNAKKLKNRIEHYEWDESRKIEQENIQKIRIYYGYEFVFNKNSLIDKIVKKLEDVNADCRFEFNGNSFFTDYITIDEEGYHFKEEWQCYDDEYDHSIEYDFTIKQMELIIKVAKMLKNKDGKEYKKLREEYMLMTDEKVEEIYKEWKEKK